MLFLIIKNIWGYKIKFIDLQKQYIRIKDKINTLHKKLSDLSAKIETLSKIIQNVIP